MNTPNNKRKKESQDKIEKFFIRLLQTKDIKEITITDICKSVKVNRSTFYANYIDIYDLVHKINDQFETEVFDLYKDERKNKNNTNNYLKLFKHIKENQIFYKTYFKLGLDNDFKISEYDIEQANKYYNNNYIDYHIEFFKAGLNAIIKKWLNSGCKETAEEIYSILTEEYNK